ncbi:hypothetical protein ACO3VM_07215 [Methanocaldococcus sp. 10A]
MGGAGVPSTGAETEPKGGEVDDAQVQHGHLSIIVHVGQTPIRKKL